MIRGKYNKGGLISEGISYLGPSSKKVPQNSAFAHFFTRKYFSGLSQLYEQTICLDNSFKNDLEWFVWLCIRMVGHLAVKSSIRLSWKWLSNDESQKVLIILRYDLISFTPSSGAVI